MVRLVNSRATHHRRLRCHCRWHRRLLSGSSYRLPPLSDISCWVLLFSSIVFDNLFGSLDKGRLDWSRWGAVPSFEETSQSFEGGSAPAGSALEAVRSFGLEEMGVVPQLPENVFCVFLRYLWPGYSLLFRFSDDLLLSVLLFVPVDALVNCYEPFSYVMRNVGSTAVSITDCFWQLC